MCFDVPRSPEAIINGELAASRLLSVLRPIESASGRAQRKEASTPRPQCFRRCATSTVDILKGEKKHKLGHAAECLHGKPLGSQEKSATRGALEVLRCRGGPPPFWCQSSRCERAVPDGSPTCPVPDVERIRSAGRTWRRPGPEIASGRRLRRARGGRRSLAIHLSVRARLMCVCPRERPPNR